MGSSGLGDRTWERALTSQHDNETGGDMMGDLIENGGYVDGMVTGWTLFVTFITPDGEFKLLGDTMEGQVATTTLGHAQAIIAIESARIVALFAEED